MATRRQRFTQVGTAARGAALASDHAASDGRSLRVLQCCVAVTLACHDAHGACNRRTHPDGFNPDKLSQPQMAAEFTNHRIPGAVLTPEVVGTIAELQWAGSPCIQ